MTIRTRNILIISISIIISLAIGLSVFLLIKKDNENALELERRYAEIEREIQHLKDERDSLNLELISIKAKLNGEGYNMGSSMILINEPDRRFLDDIYPYLNANGFKGIISVGANYFINSNGMMDSTQLSNLVLNDGYELSMSVTSESNIQALYKNFKSNNLPDPKIAYYQNNDIDLNIISSLKELGINTVIVYDSLPKIEDDVFYIRAYGSYKDETKDEFNKAINNSYPFALTIGYFNSYEKYNASNLNNILSSLKLYEKEFPAKSTSNARIRYENYLDTSNNDKDELIKRRDKINERLDVLKEEIARRRDNHE